MKNVIKSARKAADEIVKRDQIYNLPHTLTSDIGLWERRLPKIISFRNISVDLYEAAKKLDELTEEFLILTTTLVGTERRTRLAESRQDVSISTQGAELLSKGEILTIMEVEKLIKTLSFVRQTSKQLAIELPTFAKSLTTNLSADQALE